MPRCLSRIAHSEPTVAMRPIKCARAIGLEWEHNLDAMARILLNEDFTFCLTRDSNELDVAKKSTRQLLRDQLHNEPWTIVRTGASRASKSACRVETVFSSSTQLLHSHVIASRTDIVILEFSV